MRLLLTLVLPTLSDPVPAVKTTRFHACQLKTKGESDGRACVDGERIEGWGIGELRKRKIARLKIIENQSNSSLWNTGSRTAYEHDVLK
jgi:hypothetical protein